MEELSLANLEFEKVLGLISSFAGSSAAKDRILSFVPLTDREEIETRLSEMDELTGFFDSGGSVSASGIRDIRDILTVLIENSTDSVQNLQGSDFLRIRANFEVFLALKKSFDPVQGFPRLQKKIFECPDFRRERDRITQTISEQGEVRDDATPRLSGIRRELAKVRQDAEKRLNEFLSRKGEIVQDRFFTLRNDRYCVPIKASSQSEISGIVHDQSGSGQTVFMEPLEFLGMNNRIARLKIEDREEILRILRELTNMLASRKADLRELFDTVVFFDVLLAKVRFSRKYGAFRPEIVPPGSLYLKDAKHPLLFPECVALTLSMTSKSGCIIITGPNGGGKTVALKTVGNNCLLLQIGCYVLAHPDSRMPIFHEILADIGESQSIENHLSTFTAHISRINEIFRRSSGRTLVLIDEIGVGTDPVEGSALAVAVLKAFLRRGALSVVTSHYDSLKQVAFQTEGFENAAMEFDYDTFSPTFRFAQGIAGKSNALLVSRAFGLPEEILREMGSHLQGHGGEEGRLLEALERERVKAEQLRRAWEEKNRTLAWQLKEQQAIMSRLEQFRRTKKDELVESFEQSLKERMKEIERIIHDFRAKLKDGVSENDVESARLTHQNVQCLLSELDKLGENLAKNHVETDARSFSSGDVVTWIGGNARGKIESIEIDLGRAIVDFDGKTLNVALSEIRKVEDGDASKTGQNSLAIGSVPFIQNEVDLRGMRVDEAIEKTQQYLKLAKAQNLGKVRLIHGKGTGALQRAVHGFLKLSPYKDKFRFGRYGEGDSGVTVVIFDPAADVEPSTVPPEKPISPKKRKFRK